MQIAESPVVSSMWQGLIVIIHALCTASLLLIESDFLVAGRVAEVVTGRSKQRNSGHLLEVVSHWRCLSIQGLLYTYVIVYYVQQVAL